MGIAKSFKSLFKTRKKKEIEGGSASPKGKPKNPVARNKVCYLRFIKQLLKNFDTFFKPKILITVNRKVIKGPY